MAILLQTQVPYVKKCLNQPIFELESFELKVLLSVCEQGGDNEGLQKTLKITIRYNEFPDPFDPARNVIFAFDWWHGLKRLRAHTLDNNLVFKNGKRASKLNFEAGKRKINSTVTCGFKLTDMVLHCVQSDRQNVDSAIALFNKSIAVRLTQCNKSHLILKVLKNGLQNVIRLLLHSIAFLKMCK